MAKHAPIWTVRVFLAVLLMAGTELLFWAGIQDYTFWDWLLRAVGNITLAVFILDIAVRYRIRVIYDAMLVFAMYGLLLALLVSPSLAFARFPDFLITRTLGGYTLLGFEMWGFFLVLTNGKTRRYRVLLLSAATWLGFYWGTWLRWIPEYGTVFDHVDLQVAFMYGGIFSVVILMMFVLVSRTGKMLTLTDFRLSTPQWAVLMAIMIGLYAYQAYQQVVTVWILMTVGALLLVCWSILWFRGNEKNDTLLDDHIPVVSPLPILWILPAAMLFVGMAIFAFNAPLLGNSEYNQLTLMSVGYLSVGALWLPFAAATLAIQGLDYQMRTGQL